MTNRFYERGAHMVVAAIVVIVALVGALGFIGYNAWQKQSTNAGDESTLGERRVIIDHESKTKKASIRIGVYNAWSVSKAGAADQVRRLSLGMSKMRDGGAEIVALQEFSEAQTRNLKKNSYWGVYRSKTDGDRGLGVAYKKNAFRVISSSDLVIPRAGADQHEPMVKLERIRDKARITVISVHLVAFANGKPNYNTYQPLQQEVVKNKVLALKSQGQTVVVAGDFNWNFNLKPGYMSPLRHRGIGYMNFMVPEDQKIVNFDSIEVKEEGISDHHLIFIDAETTSFGE